jgi:hypothetical protein
MKIYRSTKDGVTVWRLSGVMERDDAVSLIRAMKGPAKRLRGCHVLDFSGVKHVDYHAFKLLEERTPPNADILLSGMNDYILDILAFTRGRQRFPLYGDWRTALQHIRLERGKILSPRAHTFAGFE